jgi:hypothetical protein
VARQISVVGEVASLSIAVIAAKAGIKSHKRGAG